MKALRFLGIALTAVTMCAGLAACSDDDNNGEPASGTSVITTEDGSQLLVTKAGSYFKFSYDDQGRCTYIYGHGDDYYISYNPFKVTIGGDDYDEGEEHSCNISFNGSGYVASFTYVYSSDDKWGKGSESCETAYTYDGDRLTKISCTGKSDWTDKEDGEKYTRLTTSIATLTWDGNNISKISVDYDDNDSYGDEHYTDTYVYNYEGAQDNKYRQYVYAIYDQLEFDDMSDAFAIMGWLGKGTAQLPVSYVADSEEGDSGTMKCYYEINSDGTLKVDDEITYTYKEIGDDTRSAVVPFGDALSAPAKTKHSLRDLHNRVKARHAATTEE